MKKTLWIIALLFTLLLVTACGNADNINPESIQVNEVLGLNEQIYLSLGKPASGEYVVSYKAVDAEEYTVVDKELLLDEEGSIGCYILGLKEGDYSVRVECGEDKNLSRVTLNDINVERQDRSGYAHFNYNEGVGGYNNDGTVKEGAKIIYVTNATKNTVTLDINGTTYTGLAEILQANAQMEEPLIIRVLDMITTNQWIENINEVGIDYSALSEEYVATLISDEYGENLAGLPVVFYHPDGTTYEYKTTPDGFVSRETDDRVYYRRAFNVIDTEYASNITIEGVGRNAGFFQFGIVFLYSDSIEVRNITTERHPTVALGFAAYGNAMEHGRYWVHNNTFNRGYDVLNDIPADETVYLCEVHSTTIAYNEFIKTGKTILMGGWEYDYQLNTTIHHNHFYQNMQRTPLSRNSNIHSYNNFYDGSEKGLSPRTSTYVFAEANYFKNVPITTYMGESSDETWGVIKSFNEIYDNCGDTYKVFKVKDRAEVLDTTKINYTCLPIENEATDYAKFDTDSTLFYYDAENKCSDVELLHKAEDVPAFLEIYAGAGVLTKMELDN